MQDAKAIQGRSADPAKCQAKFDQKVEKIRAQAAASAVPCRYRDNGDNAVTDFDTGLMWVKQVALASPLSDALVTWRAGTEADSSGVRRWTDSGTICPLRSRTWSCSSSARGVSGRRVGSSGATTHQSTKH
jgi:hypothetical protein